MNASVHQAVLARETLEALSPSDGSLYVDATFGAGGISRALLEAADCSVIAIDRDPGAVRRADALATEFAGRFEIIEGRFSAMEALVRPRLAAHARSDVDGVGFDFGVSSPQLDEAERGFSFQKDGPLDMRMSGEGRSAADIVNEANESELEQILRIYGEERQAKRIARAIIAAREAQPITRTLELARLIEKTVHQRPPARIHPATRTFQALRIAVNEELGEIAMGLSAAERLLKAAGRIAVVSFHSLEDRIVKLFLAERSKRAPAPSRHAPAKRQEATSPSFRILTKRPVTPDAAEIETNPRARSAKLRVAERTDAPFLPLNLERLGIVELAP